MKPLGWYLEKIGKREPVSKRAFHAAWTHEGLGFNSLHMIFGFGDGDRHVVTIRQSESFKQLQKQFCFMGSRNSRIEAAVGGNSHTVRVDGALILTRTLDHPYPSVIVFGPSGTALPRSIKSQALIIENLQNFLLLNETIEFVQRHSDLNGKDVEVLFGGGNAINNWHHREFLKGFERTWWLMDADLGGFKIIANALNFLPSNKIEIIIPSDLNQRLKDHGQSISQENLDGVLAIARNHKILQPMAAAVFDQKKQLEQETYLLPGLEKLENGD